MGQRYRAARCPLTRSHLRIVWLLSQGRSAREVAAATGYGQRWIAEIVRRYNAEGADGLGDQRARNTGARPLLGQEDEAALRDALAEPPAEGGLWTGPRRQWAPIGQRPIALGQHRFEWLYVYGFVDPGTGEVVWFLCNGVGTVLLSAVLAAFATAVGAGPDKLVVLVLDNAGWHSSEQLVVPDGLRLAFL